MLLLLRLPRLRRVLTILGTAQFALSLDQPLIQLNLPMAMGIHPVAGTHTLLIHPQLLAQAPTLPNILHLMGRLPPLLMGHTNLINIKVVHPTLLHTLVVVQPLLRPRHWRHLVITMVPPTGLPTGSRPVVIIHSDNSKILTHSFFLNGISIALRARTHAHHEETKK